MSFEEIYELFYPKVFRLCMAYVNDYESANDLTQETFISVWQHLGGFRNQSSIGTWVFRIATNNCLRSVQRETRQVKTALPEQLEDKPEETNEEIIQQLYTAIGSLPETERIIISLVLEDLPQAEIADIVGLSNGHQG